MGKLCVVCQAFMSKYLPPFPPNVQPIYLQTLRDIFQLGLVRILLGAAELLIKPC